MTRISQPLNVNENSVHVNTLQMIHNLLLENFKKGNFEASDLISSMILKDPIARPDGSEVLITSVFLV